MAVYVVAAEDVLYTSVVQGTVTNEDGSSRSADVLPKSPCGHCVVSVVVVGCWGFRCHVLRSLVGTALICVIFHFCKAAGVVVIANLFSVAATWCHVRSPCALVIGGAPGTLFSVRPVACTAIMPDGTRVWLVQGLTCHINPLAAGGWGVGCDMVTGRLPGRRCCLQGNMNEATGCQAPGGAAPTSSLGPTIQEMCVV